MLRFSRLAALTLILLFATTLTVSAQGQSTEPYDVTLSGSENIKDTKHFRIHYTLTGDDETDVPYVEAVGDALEKAWHVEVELMGWAAPPTDGSRGGNALYDVFIEDLTDEGALGITSPEDRVGDNPNTPATESWSATSYLSIDNHLSDSVFTPGQDEYSLMRTTVAHEFNHALQFGYDISDAHDWIYEATATWMETEAVGGDQDATGYVQDNFGEPSICFGSVANEDDSRLHYGDWLFIDHMAQDFGEEFIPDVWSYVADYEGFEVLEHALESKGTTLDDEMATYNLRNLARDYRLGNLFNATVHAQDIITDASDWSENGDGVQELGAQYFTFAAEPGQYQVRLTRDSDDLTLWALGVYGQKVDAFKLNHGGVIDTTRYDKFYLMVFNPKYDDDLEECDTTRYRLNIESGEGTMPDVYRTFGGQNFLALPIPVDKGISETGIVVRVFN